VARPGVPAAKAGARGREEDQRVPAAANQDAVHAIVQRLSGQLDATAKRMIERYREEIVDYKLADDDFVYGDVYGVSMAALEVTVATLERGDHLSPEGFECVRAGAARRVHQGVSLESFHHAARLWGQVLWQSVLSSTQQGSEAEREAALRIAGRVFENIDFLSLAATQGYLDELQAVWSDREVLGHDLLEALIAGDGESEHVRRLARSLRVRLSESYLVVVARTEEPPAEEILEQSLAKRPVLSRVIEAARERLRPRAGHLLVGLRHGEVVVLYPFEDAADLEIATQSCCALARDLEGAAVAVGMSACHRGLTALAVGYGEAKEAVEIAVETGAHGRLVPFDEVLIDSIVRSSQHSERILDGTVTPLLEYDSEHHSELIFTLRAYVDSGFNLTKSAEALCVHPNTVVYRLRRIKELTGRDPHVPDDLLLLHLGLKLIEHSPGSRPTAATAS
jgi:sugar diacid utilization regulator